jgi:voltage-gated potassium channel
MTAAPISASSLASRMKSRVNEVFASENQVGPLARVANGFLALMILLNVAAVVLETVASVQVRYRDLFYGFLVVSVAVFTVEYLLRIWACTEHPSGRYKRAVVGRLRYMVSPLALFDLLAILPFYLSAFIPLDLRFLRVVRALWILKVMRYLPAVETLGVVVRRERNTLFALVALLFVILFLASSLVYLFEHEVQPESFASIPHALWWGMATLTTVGYGDVVPQSPMGKLLGGVIMLLGIATFALPAGILAAAFTEAAKRKSFMVTWNLVAHMPFFSHLKAAEIARITDLLRPRTLTPNEVIFHRDEDAYSMYFIVAGVVEVELIPEPIKLRKGDYFGEVALLYHRKRTATVMAVTYVELLELDKGDLDAVLDANPDLKTRVMSEAERRLSRTDAVY